MAAARGVCDKQCGPAAVTHSSFLPSHTNPCLCSPSLFPSALIIVTPGPASRRRMLLFVEVRRERGEAGPRRRHVTEAGLTQQSSRRALAAV